MKYENVRLTECSDEEENQLHIIIYSGNFYPVCQLIK